MADWFDRHISHLAFRLELVRDDSGGQHIVWHYLTDDWVSWARVFRVL